MSGRGIRLAEKPHVNAEHVIAEHVGRAFVPGCQLVHTVQCLEGLCRIFTEDFGQVLLAFFQ
jgi:hypothetical protein